MLKSSVLRPAAFTALAFLAAGTPATACPNVLFVIERSTNANVVVYEAHFLPSGMLDERSPLTISWRMADGRREELSGMERAWAYGAKLVREENGYRVALRALPSRPMRLVVEGGCPSVRMQIGEEPSALEKIFVDVSRGGLVPSVKSIDVVGRSLATDRETRERIDPSSARSASTVRAGK